LTTFYGSKPEGAALDEGRADIGRWSKERLEGPVGSRLRTYQVARLAERPINNAQLVGVLIYRTHLDWFERWFQQHQGDVPRRVAELRKRRDGAEGNAAVGGRAAAVGVAPNATDQPLRGQPAPDAGPPAPAAP